MNSNVVNFKEKFSKFNELWSPKIIAQMNDYHFKLAKVKGDFTWHDHKDSDEVFIVIEGSVRIDIVDEESIFLEEGEMFVVPKGVKHKPYSETECKLLIIEPAGTVNTGEAGGELTAESNVWI